MKNPPPVTLDINVLRLSNEPGWNAPHLSFETWSGDALPDGPRGFLKLDDELRELTAEEAFGLAEQLMNFGRARSEADGEKNRKEIAGFISRLSGS